jgi:carbon monoxide dehydrogenase subunit G
MITFETTEFINRPPQDVFAFLADPANYAKYQASTISAEWTSTGIPGVGSTFKVLSKTPGGTTEVMMKVTIWEPSNQHGVQSIKIPFPFKKANGVTTLVPKDNGTQLTFHGEYVAIGIFRFAEGFLGKQIKEQDASNIRNMKQLLEAGT